MRLTPLLSLFPLRSNKVVLNHWSLIYEAYSDLQGERELAAPYLEFEQSIMPGLLAIFNSLLISQRRIAEIKQYGELMRLLVDMTAREKEKIRERLDKVGWAIDDAEVLRAILGDEPIEEVRANARRLL